MITERIDYRQLLSTLEGAVRTLAQAQGATITVTHSPTHNIEVNVELPDGMEYIHGHSGFGMSSDMDDCSHLDVWHDVLMGISFPVVAADDDDDCTCDH